MEDGEPGAGESAQRRQPSASRASSAGSESPRSDGLMSEIRLTKLGPGIGPPPKIRVRRKAPGAGRRVDIAETRYAPAQQPASGVRFTPVERPPRDTARAIGQCRARGVPGHCRTVGITYGNQTAWYADPAHFAEGRDRIGEVLQQLMGMNDVEGGAAESEVDVPDNRRRFHVPRIGWSCVAATAAGVDADNRALRQPSGEVDGDGSRTDADIQQPVGRLQPWQQICRGILSSSPTV